MNVLCKLFVYYRKREQRELNNKLTRDTNEKDLKEKREKLQKKKEERAKQQTPLPQKKQHKEMEKKLPDKSERAQKEERKLEEPQRLQNLQDQKETERSLAEQRRRDQEAEKRKEPEARAQQQAAAEPLRQKNQVLATQAKVSRYCFVVEILFPIIAYITITRYKSDLLQHIQQIDKKHPGATNYVLDSEPDDDESDNENKPKHEIPYWAQRTCILFTLVRMNYY